MASRKYEQAGFGEWIPVAQRNFKLMCCDCHLIHKVDFRYTNKERYEVRFKRDDRATAVAAPSNFRRIRRQLSDDDILYYATELTGTPDDK